MGYKTGTLDQRYKSGSVPGHCGKDRKLQPLSRRAAPSRTNGHVRARDPRAPHRRPHLGLRSAAASIPARTPSLTPPPSQGTNLQALIDAQNTPALPSARISLVLSNRKAAYGLTRAAEAAPPIPTAYLGLQPFLKAHPGSTRDDYDRAVAARVAREDPDLVVLAGWMHIMGDGFLEVVSGDVPYAGEDGQEVRVRRRIPVINLHPALPGAFDGAHAIERAYEAFQKGEIKHSGVMVHYVVKEVDRGEPVLVREVEILPGEPIEAFEERLHSLEWKIIVEATAKVLDQVAPTKVSTLFGLPRYTNLSVDRLYHSKLYHSVFARSGIGVRLAVWVVNTQAAVW